MHITDKEKKAIYEAMKQIRENQKVTEDNKIFDRDIAKPSTLDGYPSRVYQGKKNDFTYTDIPAGGMRIATSRDTDYMSTDPLGPNVPAESGIFTPDSESFYSGTMGRGSARGGAEETNRRQDHAYGKKFGLARINSTVDGTRFRGSDKGFEKYKTKGTKTKLSEIHGQPPPGARRLAQMQADRADRPSVLNSFLNRTMDRGQDLLQRGTNALQNITGTGRYALPDMYGRRRSPIVDELKAIADDPGRAFRRITGNETPMERIQRINAQPYPGRQVIMGEQQSRPQSAPMSTPTRRQTGPTR